MFEHWTNERKTRLNGPKSVFFTVIIFCFLGNNFFPFGVFIYSPSHRKSTYPRHKGRKISYSHVYLINIIDISYSRRVWIHSIPTSFNYDTSELCIPKVHPILKRVCSSLVVEWRMHRRYNNTLAMTMFKLATTSKTWYLY